MYIETQQFNSGQLLSILLSNVFLVVLPARLLKPLSPDDAFRVGSHPPQAATNILSFSEPVPPVFHGNLVWGDIQIPIKSKCISGVADYQDRDLTHHGIEVPHVIYSAMVRGPTQEQRQQGEGVAAH